MIADVLLGYILPLAMLIIAGYLIKNFRDEKILKWVKIAVQSAEQLFSESGMGTRKFEYVKNWITDKFKISDEDLRNIIESAVFELNKEK